MKSYNKIAAIITTTANSIKSFQVSDKEAWSRLESLDKDIIHIIEETEEVTIDDDGEEHAWIRGDGQAISSLRADAFELINWKYSTELPIKNFEELVALLGKGMGLWHRNNNAFMPTWQDALWAVPNKDEILALPKYIIEDAMKCTYMVPNFDHPDLPQYKEVYYDHFSPVTRVPMEFTKAPFEELIKIYKDFYK